MRKQLNLSTTKPLIIITSIWLLTVIWAFFFPVQKNVLDGGINDLLYILRYNILGREKRFDRLKHIPGMPV